MKTKIFSIFSFAAILALTGCSDIDSVKDLVLDRVLMPTDLTAIPSSLDPEINMSWTAMSNADQYVVQAFTSDPEASDILPTVNDTVTGDATTIEYTITDLAPTTTYYVRVRGISETTNDSKWNMTTCTTKDEQILAVHAGYVTQNSATVFWPKTKKCDKIEVLNPDGASVKDVTIPDYTTGQITIDGLDAGTTYTFNCYNGTAKRGTITQTTVEGNPEGDYNATLTASSTSSTKTFQSYLDDFAAQAATAGKTAYTAVITIAAGEEVYLNNLDASGVDADIKVPNGMSLVITGATDDMTSKIKTTKIFNLAGTHENIVFQKLTINSGSYMINQPTSDDCNVTNVIFKYCDVPTIGGNTLIRFQKGSVTNITLEACNIYGNCSNYYLIDLTKVPTVKANVYVSNTTVANYTSTLKGILGAKGNLGTVSLKNSTFYNSTNSSNYYVDANSGTTIDRFEVVGCIFSCNKGSSITAANVFRPATGTTGNISGNYYTNDTNKTFTEGVATLFDKPATDLFVDPDNKDFTVKVASISAGDARKAPLPYAE